MYEAKIIYKYAPPTYCGPTETRDEASRLARAVLESGRTPARDTVWKVLIEPIKDGDDTGDQDRDDSAR